jgi:bacillithiol biosynthesis cysteine-adding enzyme BshC
MTVIPLSKLPGIPALAAGLATGTPDVSAFLPDHPDLPTIGTRVPRVLAAFRPRAHAGGAVALASGRSTGVFAGQQVGLFTGPLLTLVKAIAATRLAGDLAATGVAAEPAFWCASEDHDLVEVTRLFLPGPDGPRDAGPDPESLAGNRRPVGELPIGVPLEPILAKAADGLSQPPDEAALKALRDLNVGRTFFEGFVGTLSWLIQDERLQLVDAARLADKPDLVPLAVRLVKERRDVRRVLNEREARLAAAGHPPQVTTDPDALPLFVRDGDERLLLLESGSRLALKGRADTWEEAEVLEKLSAGEWVPSFSALTRPLAASVLYPVAATILGPAEIAYWAQSRPLFEWAGIVPPVIVPRPLVCLVSPTTKRLLSKLELTVEDALEGKEALLIRRGAGRADAYLKKLEALRDTARTGLEALKGELVGIDPSLGKAAETTREKVLFAFEKLAEKTAAAAGRSEGTVAQQIARLVDELLPDGRLAERVYSPLPWLLRFGRDGLVEPIRRELKWDTPGLQVIEL